MKKLGGFSLPAPPPPPPSTPVQKSSADQPCRNRAHSRSYVSWPNRQTDVRLQNASRASLSTLKSRSVDEASYQIACNHWENPIYTFPVPRNFMTSPVLFVVGMIWPRSKADSMPRLVSIIRTFANVHF